ncbi:hypothetical protein KAR91_05860 [Candidatus Pacearchaeota archaeon]|nr:hypothetical protein [Candidatus Pacearchaeota archaeon]
MKKALVLLAMIVLIAGCSEGITDEFRIVKAEGIYRVQKTYGSERWYTLDTDYSSYTDAKKDMTDRETWIREYNRKMSLDWKVVRPECGKHTVKCDYCDKVIVEWEEHIEEDSSSCEAEIKSYSGSIPMNFSGIRTIDNTTEIHWTAITEDSIGAKWTEKECKAHDKVFSNIILTSNPAQYPWICRLCGFNGVDQGEYLNTNEYEGLIEKFKDNK